MGVRGERTSHPYSFKLPGCSKKPRLFQAGFQQRRNLKEDIHGLAILLVTFLGWLSDLQIGDEKVTLNHLGPVRTQRFFGEPTVGRRLDG